MATCEKNHSAITYDDVLGLVPCPLCETLVELESATQQLEEAIDLLERRNVPMTPKQPLPCVPM